LALLQKAEFAVYVFISWQ